MKTISYKKSICETIKVLYSFDENYFEDIMRKKIDGWKVVTKPNYYYDSEDIIIKSSSNGFVLTYKKYSRI